MIDPTVRTYDPQKVIVTFGPIIATGYADGTFISVERNGNMFEKVRGADGGVDRVNKNAFDFGVTLTLKQTSPTNNALSAMMTADQLTNAGIVPLLVKDLLGNTIFAAPQAWIAKEPTMEDGSDLGTREWLFETGPAVNFIGGN